MPEPSEDRVRKATLRHEQDMTLAEVREIAIHLSTYGERLTRADLVGYLRTKARQIQADLIQEGK